MRNYNSPLSRFLFKATRLYKQALGHSRNIVYFPIMHFVVLYGIFSHEYWYLVLPGIILLFYPVHQLGYSAGIHKCFAHNAFTPKKWYPYLSTLVSSLTYLPNPLLAAGHHRIHHRYSDTDKDPHTPKHGFWHSYWLWTFNPLYKGTDCLKVTGDLNKRYPWMLKMVPYDIYIFYALQATIYYISFDLFVIINGVGLMSRHFAMWAAALAHGKNSEGEWVSLDRPWMARWINPVMMHDEHHKHPERWDYSAYGIRDYGSYLIKYILSEDHNTLSNNVAPWDESLAPWRK